MAGRVIAADCMHAALALIRKGAPSKKTARGEKHTTLFSFGLPVAARALHLLKDPGVCCLLATTIAAGVRLILLLAFFPMRKWKPGGWNGTTLR